MEDKTSKLCNVCIKELSSSALIHLSCGHLTCSDCMKEYIQTLKVYKLLHPSKLHCLQENCKMELQDSIFFKLYPGQEGVLLSFICKRYKESKNPLTKIFGCLGFVASSRKSLIDKRQLDRKEHSKLTNALVKDIRENKTHIDNIKVCTNILSINTAELSKEKYLLCYICGVSYCLKCLELFHDQPCRGQAPSSKFISKLTPVLSDSQQSFQQFIAANKMARCLNPKCGVPIAKEEGCFWVKCRCSWEFCYPCQKLWGECEHFKNYPYEKFVPPPEWMVKALNLY